MGTFERHFCIWEHVEKQPVEAIDWNIRESYIEKLTAIALFPQDRGALHSQARWLTCTNRFL